MTLDCGLHAFSGLVRDIGEIIEAVSGIPDQLRELLTILIREVAKCQDIHVERAIVKQESHDLVCFKAPSPQIIYNEWLERVFRSCCEAHNGSVRLFVFCCQAQNDVVQ